MWNDAKAAHLRLYGWFPCIVHSFGYQFSGMSNGEGRTLYMDGGAAFWALPSTRCTDVEFWHPTPAMRKMIQRLEESDVE